MEMVWRGSSTLYKETIFSFGKKNQDVWYVASTIWNTFFRKIKAKWFNSITVLLFFYPSTSAVLSWHFVQSDKETYLSCETNKDIGFMVAAFTTATVNSEEI